jgi:hypothetical protein
MNPLKWILSFLPEDPSTQAGWGPFRLPEECDWMQKDAEVHDYDYSRSGTSGQKLSEADGNLFQRWAMRAMQEEDPIKRCRKFTHICKYWPIARNFGRYLWRGKD